jgi:hypothetical protein
VPKTDDYAVRALVFFITMIVTAVVLLAFRQAWGHAAPSGMVYDGVCCNGDGVSGDCHHIPPESVETLRDGYRITLAPGQHPKVTATRQYRYDYAAARQSTDGQYHICLHPDETNVQCLYVPPMGS